jgi:DNA-directed RNA polymerase specialized sigma subunit
VFAVASEFAVDDCTLLDHYQVGTLGLLRGISNYNPDKGSFSAYAKLWIRQGILSSIKDMNLIKIPASTWQCYTTLERKRSSLHNNDMRRLSVSTGITEDRISDVYEKVRTSQVCPIDAPVDSDGDFEDGEIHSYEEIIEDTKPVEEEPPPSFDWIKNDLAKRLMICCHGDIMELISLQPIDITENDILCERIRHLISNVVN